MTAEAANKQVAGRAPINVSRTTKEALDSIKHPGQSYDGLIQELLKFYTDKKQDYWTRRRLAKKGVLA